MKKSFAVLVIASLVACNASSTNSTVDSIKINSMADSSSKMSPMGDSSMGAMSDAATDKLKKMVDTAKIDVKMMGDSSKK